MSAAPVRNAWGLLLVLTLLNIINFADRYLIIAFSTRIVPELGLSNLQFGLLTGIVFTAVYTIFGLFLGSLADRVHRPRLIAAGLAFFFIVIEALAEGQGFWCLVALTLFVPGVNLISVWVTLYYLLRIADGSLGRWVYFTQVLCGAMSYFILFAPDPSPFDVLREKGEAKTTT